MDDPGRRRLLLGGAGALAAFGLGASAVTLTDGDDGGAPAGVIDVRRHGARGDGRTDDTGAVQAALDAVPQAGGVVLLPPGDYLISAPLRPRSRTLLVGCHVPRWTGQDVPDSACRLRVAEGFRGDGLIAPAGDVVAVALVHLALVGAGVGSGIDGLRMPRSADVTATESSWHLDSVTIAGFTGSGITGRVHVAVLRSVFVHNNRRWGIEATDGDRWSDVHLADSFVFYNRLGGLHFGGRGVSSLIDVVNCRFERNGTDPLDVDRPLNPAAPGLRLASARLVELVNCSTDANCGNGIEIVAGADTPVGLPEAITLTNVRLNRDGTGDGVVESDFAGLRVEGTAGRRIRFVKAIGCTVRRARAADDGTGVVVGPRYGVWFEGTDDLQWIGGDLASFDGAAFFEGPGTAADNTRTLLVDLSHGLLTLPAEAPTEGVAVPDGAASADDDGMHVRVAGRWRTAPWT